jgi:murein DD-endopeptidase MepM/ murein hydrolase activator NlpD
MTRFTTLIIAGHCIQALPAVAACDLGASNADGVIRLKRPMPTEITATFGQQMHPLLGRVTLHPGIDFAGATGDPVAAAATGEVVEARFKGEYGNAVTLRHADGWQTFYSQLSRFGDGIAVGGCITAGSIIGFVGSTGLSAGPHLHFEAHLDGQSVDPELLLVDAGK